MTNEILEAVQHIVTESVNSLSCSMERCFTAEGNETLADVIRQCAEGAESIATAINNLADAVRDAK